MWILHELKSCLSRLGNHVLLYCRAENPRQKSFFAAAFTTKQLKLQNSQPYDEFLYKTANVDPFAKELCF